VKRSNGGDAHLGRGVLEKRVESALVFFLQESRGRGGADGRSGTEEPREQDVAAAGRFFRAEPFQSGDAQLRVALVQRAGDSVGEGERGRRAGREEGVECGAAKLPRGGVEDGRQQGGSLVRGERSDFAVLRLDAGRQGLDQFRNAAGRALAKSSLRKRARRSARICWRRQRASGSVVVRTASKRVSSTPNGRSVSFRVAASRISKVSSASFWISS
jgi:hypothetical protein